MLDKLTEDQRKVLLIWFFLLIFLIGAVSLFSYRRIKSKFHNEVDKQYNIVTDYSRYYTVLNILDKYYTYINNGNYEDVLKMLDKDFVNENHIDTHTITNFIKKYDIRTTYKGSLMCSKRLGNGYTSYYVSGNVIGVNKYKEYEDQYYEVVLNENEMTFTVKSIDSNQFGGECHA